MKVLVTGATGYVGSRLVPRLLKLGHQVRVTTSRPDRELPAWGDQVEKVVMDVSNPDQVQSAVEGMDALYYLIHGMADDDFVEADRQAATNMKKAIDHSGVSRVVYLSGIVPDIAEEDLSDHLKSRLEVEKILTTSAAVTITIRAAILLGSGSTSFEVIRQISERLPVQTVPQWMDHEVQPIAVVDVLEVLVRALKSPDHSRFYEVGGPQSVSYGELLDLYTTTANLQRPQVMVPLLPQDLVAQLASVVVDVPAPTVRHLVKSLEYNMVCTSDDFIRELLPPGWKLVGLQESIERSLAKPDAQYSDPMAAQPQDPDWAGSRSLTETLTNAASSVLREAANKIRPKGDTSN